MQAFIFVIMLMIALYLDTGMRLKICDKLANRGTAKALKKPSKYLKKSFMNRQNAVMTRGHLKATRKQQIGCTNNRQLC